MIKWTKSTTCTNAEKGYWWKSGPREVKLNFLSHNKLKWTGWAGNAQPFFIFSFFRNVKNMHDKNFKWSTSIFFRATSKFIHFPNWPVMIHSQVNLLLKWQTFDTEINYSELLAHNQAVFQVNWIIFCQFTTPYEH